METDAQKQLLESWQCDQIQGYLISKPVSAERFGALLENYRKRFPDCYPESSEAIGKKQV